MYAIASGSASGGVFSHASVDCDNAKPRRHMASDKPRKNTALVPTTRLASAKFLAPMHCPTITVDAIEKPNRTPNSRNITTLELPTAAKAASPRYFPTQTALTEPLTDCSTLPNRIGSANASSERGMGPSVNEYLVCTNSPRRRLTGFGR